MYPRVPQHARAFRKKQLSLARTNVPSRGTSSAELMAQDPGFQGRALAGPAGEADIPRGGASLHSIDQSRRDKFRPATSGSTIALGDVARKN